MIRFFLFLTFMVNLWNLGCASQLRRGVAKLLPDKGPVRLELNPEVGSGDRTNYHSRTITKTFSNGEISRKIVEGVDFTVDTKVIHIDAATRVGTYQLTTIEKEGKTDLNDFAMPELGETFEYVLTPKGQVLKAGQMPLGTLYYVPPVSLPKEDVEVGDSWPLSAEWISAKSGIPLRMEIVSILKNLRDCGLAGTCAEIELSGDVTIAGAKNNVLANPPVDSQHLMMRFRSEVRGRILLSLKKGSVLFSMIRSDEQLNGEKDAVQISSCIVSYVTEPASDRIFSENISDCDPVGELPKFTSVLSK